MNMFEGHMGNFGEMLGIQERIADAFGRSCETIRAGDLADIAGAIGGGAVNCYPGTPGGGCHETAFFFSLKNHHGAKGKGHLSLPEVFHALMQHCTVFCAGHTRNAIVVVDTWDPKVFKTWEPTVRMIASSINLQFYLVAAGRIVQIPI